jgi:hypothetical protein
VGTPLDASDVRRDFRALYKKAGIEGVWAPRELRHTFVSVMCSTRFRGPWVGAHIYPRRSGNPRPLGSSPTPSLLWGLRQTDHVCHATSLGRWRASAGARLLPELLPWSWSTTDARRQAWNIAPVSSHRWTTRDGPPKPTDKKVVPDPCPTNQSTRGHDGHSRTALCAS